MSYVLRIQSVFDPYIQMHYRRFRPKLGWVSRADVKGGK